MSILKENIFFGFFHEDLVAHSGVVPGLISKIARKLHGTRGCGTAGKLQVPSSWHHDRHVGNFSAKTCMIRGPNDFQEWPPEMPWKWWKGHDVFSKKKATFFNPPFFFLPLKECLISCLTRGLWYKEVTQVCVPSRFGCPEGQLKLQGSFRVGRMVKFKVKQNRHFKVKGIQKNEPFLFFKFGLTEISVIHFEQYS